MHITNFTGYGSTQSTSGHSSFFAILGSQYIVRCCHFLGVNLEDTCHTIWQGRHKFLCRIEPIKGKKTIFWVSSDCVKIYSGRLSHVSYLFISGVTSITTPTGYYELVGADESFLFESEEGEMDRLIPSSPIYIYITYTLVSSRLS